MTTISSAEPVKPPVWFWVTSVAALLWNLIGVSAYLGQAFMSEAARAGMTEAQLELMDNTPAWVTAAFAIGAWGGLLGCIALLLRKKWAKPVFLVSLLAVAIQMTYSLFMTRAAEVYGSFQGIVLPILVVGIALLLYLFAGKGVNRGWLR